MITIVIARLAELQRRGIQPSRTHAHTHAHLGEVCRAAVVLRDGCGEVQVEYGVPPPPGHKHRLPGALQQVDGGGAAPAGVPRARVDAREPAARLALQALLLGQQQLGGEVEAAAAGRQWR